MFLSLSLVVGRLLVYRLPDSNSTLPICCVILSRNFVALCRSFITYDAILLSEYISLCDYNEVPNLCRVLTANNTDPSQGDNTIGQRVVESRLLKLRHCPSDPHNSSVKRDSIAPCARCARLVRYAGVARGGARNVGTISTSIRP